MILGIDPGVTGAMCGYTLHVGPTFLMDIPIIQDGRKTKQLDVWAFLVWLRDLDPKRVILERQNPMPRDGCVQAFRTGLLFGQIRAAVEAMAIPLSLVSPVVWKRYHSLLSSEKEQSRLVAIAKFPKWEQELSRKKDHNRADAMLIADWGAAHWRGLAAGTV